MTEVFAKPKVYEGNLSPYQHVERGVDRGRAKDPVGYLQSVEQRAREKQIAYETVRLLRQRVIECSLKEGINSSENCQKEVLDYMAVISKKDLGQLQPKWSKPELQRDW